MPKSSKSGNEFANALLARVVHASVEGSAFLFTRDGIRAFSLLNTLAVMYALGIRKTVGIGLQCGLVCSAARFAVVLGTTKGKDADNSLASIWDYSPSGDLASSGAWKVLTELAKTLSEGGEAHGELAGLEAPSLPELLVRLLFLYRHVQEHPVHDKLEEDDILGDVSSSLVETLCLYLFFADQAYDCGTEDNLKILLEEYGYELNFVKLSSTWAEHRPAYFVATHPKKKEFLITVRGTAQVEDVVTDLTALPEELEGKGHLVHGGMLQSAKWLYERLHAVTQVMDESGYTITIVGHSLGAGSAAILAVLLKQAGIRNIVCYAFATPNCMDLDLAIECAENGLVTSVVFRDDIVARFSPEALATLLEELKALDLDAELQKAEEHDDKLINFAAFVGNKLVPDDNSAESQASPRKAIQRSLSRSESQISAGEVSEENFEDHDSPAADGLSQKEITREQEPQDDSEAEKKSEEKSYRAHIPGKIVYIYRDKDADEEKHELALVKTTCPALRQIRLSDKVVKDHLVDSYFLGFGRENPSKIRQRAKEEEEKLKAEGEEESNEDAKEKRREKGGSARDKEAKDEGRSWLAKIGLVG